MEMCDVLLKIIELRDSAESASKEKWKRGSGRNLKDVETHNNKAQGRATAYNHVLELFRECDSLGG